MRELQIPSWWASHHIVYSATLLYTCQLLDCMNWLWVGIGGCRLRHSFPQSSSDSPVHTQGLTVGKLSTVAAWASVRSRCASQVVMKLVTNADESLSNPLLDFLKSRFCKKMPSLQCISPVSLAQRSCCLLCTALTAAFQGPMQSTIACAIDTKRSPPDAMCFSLIAILTCLHHLHVMPIIVSCVHRQTCS